MDDKNRERFLVRSLAFNNVRDSYAELAAVMKPFDELAREIKSFTEMRSTYAELAGKIESNVRDSYAEIERITSPDTRLSLLEETQRRAEVERIMRSDQEARRVRAEIEHITSPNTRLSLLEETQRRAEVERVMRSDQEARRVRAEMECMANPDMDLQLRVLTATQTRFEFPNIIKGRLSVNPFHISTPKQRSTPLLEPSPTVITSETYEEISPETIPAPSPNLVPITNHKPVFIVHGHDHETRDEVAKFVSNWGLTATILDKQPNEGRTIIKKFEDCADEAGFAIVLFTPDDVGASVKNRTDLRYRARQNVILELGYLIKALGRERVCILRKEGVELPSDIDGVVYVPLDDAGEWRQAIIREMIAVEILINKDTV